ncbi:MAG: amidohydrolase family protein [Flavobacteriaceae bacterium]
MSNTHNKAKLKSFLKWSFISLLMLIIIYLCILFYVKSEVRHHSGQNTPVVDTSELNILSGRLAIKNISVLSKDSQSMITNQTVILKDRNIEYVGDSLIIPPEYQIIDGTGKYLIPGLIDTHAHPYESKNDLLLHLVNGVTHIASMNSKNGLYLQWEKEIEDGTMLSPKMYIAAGGLSTKKGMWPKVEALFGGNSGCNTPEQAREYVRKYKKQGYDAIKSYNLDKDVYFALNDEAKKQNIPVVGHLIPDITLEEFYASGQSQLAHVEEITKAIQKEFLSKSKKYYDSIDGYLSYMRKNADQVAIKLKEKNVVVSSTVWIIESIPQQDFDLPNFLKTIELEYENSGILEGSTYKPGWFPGSNRYEDPSNTDPKSKKLSEQFWNIYIEAIHIMTRALVRHGVVLTAGTDSIGWGAIPGFSLHDEFESLHNVGLSNAQILHAATLAPTEWMGTNAGKIEVGRAADFVILDKSPLEKISNTRSINAVITQGKYLNRNQLDIILKNIKDANNKNRKVSIDAYIID